MTRFIEFGICSALCGMLAAVGCAAPRAPAPSIPQPPAATAAASTPQPPDLGHHMRASFWDSLEARDALIAGDLARAQKAADHLAQTDYAALLPADWMHWTAQLQQRAGELSLAADLGSAAQALGRIALVCGECHELHKTGPAHPRVQPLPWEDPPEELDARMQRHQQGIEQMWDGLVLPSEQAFRSGTVTITRAPLRAPEQAAAPIDEALKARIEEVRALAKDARRASTYEERGRVYGELISRCAQCHYYQRPQ
jgi:hypothetical protein